jgi:hemimethylated DNA binding protein
LIHHVKSINTDGWAYRDITTPEDEGESPAVEVMRYKDPEGYFAGSPEPRSPRPPEVRFRIGQVIKHKRWGYRGVIIGWDSEARAPEQWLRQMHPPDKPHWRKQPNYSILVDTRDRLDAQTTYVPQENIDVLVNTQVFHPEIENHFETFDGAQYIARPWLKGLYPHDQ